MNKLLANKFFKLIQNNLFIFLIFLVLPYLFFATNINIFTQAIAPGDGVLQGIPTKIFTSQLQLWNPYVQTGTFPLKDIGWQALYLPGILVMSIFPNEFGYNLLLLTHYSLAGFFTFLFLSKLNLRRTAAFIGGLTFMFCGFLTAHKGHHTMLMAASYLPIIFYFFQSFVASKKYKYLFIAGIMFGMSILADYTAVPMYIGMLLFPYIVFTFVIESGFAPAVVGDTRHFFQTFLNKLFLIVKSSFLIFGIGLLIAAVQLVPIVESLNYVTRQTISYDFFASYSFPFWMAPILIFPYFFGAGTLFLNATVTYFGPWNLTELVGYIGILPIFFAGMGIVMFWKKSWRIIFWCGAALFTALLVLGDSTPFYKLMYHVPLYNMFRVPARNWLEVHFAVTILGAYFVNYIIAATQVEIKRYLKIIIPVSAVFGIGVLFLIMFSSKFGRTAYAKNKLLENIQLSSPAIYIPLIIISVSIIILLLIYKFGKTRQLWFSICLVIFLDLFSFGHFHDTVYPNFEVLQNKPNNPASYLNKEDPDKNAYRILPLYPRYVTAEDSLYPLTNLLYGFNATNGYGAIWLKDFQNLTSFTATGNAVAQENLLRNSSIVSLLSTKYLLVSNSAEKKFIETLMVNEPSSKSEETIASGFDPKNGNYISPESMSGDSVVLKSKGSNQISLVQIPIKIEPNTNYKVLFTARTPEEHNPKDVLIVDFFGDNYDSPTQEAYFDSTVILKDFQENYAILNSGANVPSSAFLRFYTFSNVAYEVKDIKLIKMSDHINYWGNSQITSPTPLYIKRYTSPEGVSIYENMNYLPRARFVQNVSEVNNSYMATEILWSDSNFNPSQTALVEGYTGENNFESGEVLASDYSKNDVVNLTVKTGNSGFLVLSDSYYVGWKAFVDGKETPIYKTNATSRGIIINGAGEHVVKFQFVPISFYAGLAISLLTLLIVGLFIYKLH